jgi:hypothetical protein
MDDADLSGLSRLHEEINTGSLQWFQKLCFALGNSRHCGNPFCKTGCCQGTKERLAAPFDERGSLKRNNCGRSQMTHEYNIVVIHLRDLPAVSGRQWNGWHTAAMFTIYYPLSSLIMQLLSVCERTKTVGLQNILSLCPQVSIALLTTSECVTGPMCPIPSSSSTLAGGKTEESSVAIVLAGTVDFFPDSRRVGTMNLCYKKLFCCTLQQAAGNLQVQNNSHLRAPYILWVSPHHREILQDFQMLHLHHGVLPVRV